MMATHRFLALLLLVPLWAGAQGEFTTRHGQVRFNASTPLEDIEAENIEVNAILRPEDRAFGVVMLISEFVFPRKLMQEHFNENYLESERFPKATFTGTLEGAAFPGPGSESEYQVTGVITIHGVSQQLIVRARILGEEGGYRLRSSFKIRPEDHDIKIPKLLFSKIAEEVWVEVDLLLKPSL